MTSRPQDQGHHASDVDDYFAGLDDATRSAFDRVRRLASEVAPEAGQGTSYGVPALMYLGKPLIGFHAGRSHLSIYPYSSRVVDFVRPDLPGYSLASGTIRFTTDKPLPDAVVRAVVARRLEEILGTT